MRTPHSLTHTTATDRPQNVIFFDTETTQIKIDETLSKQILKVGYVIRTRTKGNDYLKVCKEYAFYDKSTFWELVSKWVRAKTITYLVAHNLVFDLVVLDGFNELWSKDFELNSFYSKGMTSIFRWSRGNAKLIGLDNTNFYPGKLAKWGEAIGEPKLEIDFKTATPDELLNYNVQDVRIMVKLWRTWLKFLDTNQCGAFKFTVPSTALNTYRHRFMEHNIYIHSNENILALERDSYKGGRTEVFYQGRLNSSEYYYLDINNLYGYILRTYTFPTSLYGSSKRVSKEILKRRLDKYLVIANVTININDNPYAYKVNTKTAYPTGLFQTTLTTPELQLAIQRDWIKEVHSIAWYNHHFIFRDYIDYFYQLRLSYRKQELTGFENIAKLFINSLYGKFGQLGLNQVVIGKTDIQNILKEVVFDLETGKKFYHIYLAGKIYRETKEGESYNSFPAVASHVTAYARMYLFSLIRKVSPSHVFYTDTDSLIVDKTGYKELESLINPNILGLLKVELQSDWLEVNAPKDYQMEGRRKTKGISPKAIEISPGVFEQEQWSRLDGLIQSGDVSEYKMRKVIKHQKREIFSGIVQPNGWVVPFHLPLSD